VLSNRKFSVFIFRIIYFSFCPILPIKICQRFKKLFCFNILPNKILDVLHYVPIAMIFWVILWINSDVLTILIESQVFSFALHFFYLCMYCFVLFLSFNSFVICG
jgi:flagellar biosynthesis protein FlhB